MAKHQGRSRKNSKKQVERAEQIERIFPLPAPRVPFHIAEIVAQTRWEYIQLLRAEGEAGISIDEIRGHVQNHWLAWFEFVANKNDEAAEQVKAVVSGIIMAVMWYMDITVNEAKMMLISREVVFPEMPAAVA